MKKKEIHPAPNQKIIPAAEFSSLIDSRELVEKTLEEQEAYRNQVAEECRRLKEEAVKKGFEEGLSQFTKNLSLLEEEIKKNRKEMEKALVPLALTAVKKIIGRELETKPETVVDIISTALKSVTHHRKIAIFINKNDLDVVEKERPKIRALFDHLETLTIAPREGVEAGGAVIETEAGIINIAKIDDLLKAIERTFVTFFQNHKWS